MLIYLLALAWPISGLVGLYLYFLASSWLYLQVRDIVLATVFGPLMLIAALMQWIDNSGVLQEVILRKK